MDDLENKTDEELWEIVKRGTNLLPHVPQSEANRAKRILEYRQSKNMNKQNVYSGTFNFQGGNNIVGSDGKIENNLTVKQFLEEMGKVLEENAPNTQEKAGLLQALKGFLVNSESGEFLGSLIGSFFKSSTK